MKSIALSALLFASVATPAAAFDPFTETARYELTWEVDMTALPEGPWRLWVPLPRIAFDQHEIGSRIDSPLPHRETWDDQQNRMLYLNGTGPAEKPLSVSFDVVREPGIGLPSNEIVRNSPDEPDKHLAPLRTVPLDGVIAQMGEKITRDATTDTEKIRALYDWVVRHMRYAKDGEGWGRGDAVWACQSKYGNCTDFHSVLLGMARSQGVPARFVMGFPIDPTKPEGEVGGYHCWAQAHETGRGWIPMDASEARKSGKPDAYFGQIPSDRVAVSIGRDRVLSPPQDGDPLNWFVYPYVEAGGKPVDTVPWKLRFKRVQMQTADRG